VVVAAENDCSLEADKNCLLDLRRADAIGIRASLDPFYF
jgi:hypothetical protein